MIIGLFLRHIKAYKGITYIPLGYEHNFVSYIGENGIGKSSILESLNSFFNSKPYPINKSAIADGIYTSGNEPFFTPIFLIEKTKVSRKKADFEKISNFFWEVRKSDLSSGVQGSMKEFFILRENLLKDSRFNKDSHFLLILGEQNIVGGMPKVYFGSFQNEESFLINYLDKQSLELDGLSNEKRKELINSWKSELQKSLDKVEHRKILQEIKELYSYVYIPVELDIEKFTKLETDEMQKIFDKKLKNEITLALDDVKLDKINTKLDDFLKEIEGILNGEYEYKTGQQRNNTITETDLVQKILQAYFQKRVLYKKEKKVTELSAGEKRQALIHIVYAFLLKNLERENQIIIAIDEPENSLHTSLCYEQFEKLHEISLNAQILITTHWYGFLPIINKGHSHFLDLKSDKIFFESYDLYDYKAKIKNDIENTKYHFPNNFTLKSTNDLVQAIYYSLQANEHYNWLIVEGVSEKIYFEYFFKDEIISHKIRILPLGGQNKVSEVYEYLNLPMREKTNLKGKVFCLIDTDLTRHKEYINAGTNYLQIRRLSNGNTNSPTVLLTLENSDTSATDIEQSLNPIIFRKAIDSLDILDEYKIKTIENEEGNSSFIKNFKNLELENFFKENNGENKIIFAKRYIEIMNQEEQNGNFIPKWIGEIKKYFNNL
ncbi:AAA family ATPase [Aliarcobacter butzleri]|uniref:AAA family ATPase n=1 Tax=Aliarcobacter butzleri TaxID=28197 RepID=UPI001EE07BD0|nr:AAA family ATPase [Aliarcobacter butzleri]